MKPTSYLASFLLVLFVASSFDAWGMNPQVLELEMMKERKRKNESQNGSFVSQGVVHKTDVPGFYRTYAAPTEQNLFWLKPDGTGLLYGGVRGTGIWNIMWAFHENKEGGGVLCVRSVQLKREYKVIRKDGTVWVVNGREIWRHHVSMNAPVRAPKDKARKVAGMPPPALQKVR